MRWLILLSGLLLPGLATAASLPEELTHTLNRLAEARGFSGQFEQTIRFSDGTLQVYKGELAILQPGRFRWHYTTPYEQLFVSDGSRIWHYEPDLMQVQILKRVQGVDPAVMRLLDGSLGLGSVTLLEKGNEADGAIHRYHVRIGAKTEIWLGLAGHRLAYVESVDALGNHNQIRLLHMAVHPPAPTAFTFKIPADVDVLPFKQTKERE